jgi:hypothetical protein
MNRNPQLQLPHRSRDRAGVPNMPQRTHAIRLAVEGGRQVKAELVSVGQSGETAGGKASRG